MTDADDVWVVHPTGNAFVRGLLAGLENSQLRARFFTSLGVVASNSAGRAPLRRRAYSLRKVELVSSPVRESLRLLLARAGFANLSERHPCSVDSVYRALDCRVAGALRNRAAKPKVVYCYEDGAREAFRAAREEGTRRVYELPIAYWETARRILLEETERWPAWKRTLEGACDSADKLERKMEEIELAETVVCPSKFVLDSLPTNVIVQKECIVVPFGSPNVSAVLARPERGQLRVLFAGSMSQRKGLADVFAAMKLLGTRAVELVVLGSPVNAPMSFYRSQHNSFIYEPPRAHPEVLRLMQTCDILVLPSLVEGRALVQQEALASGLPILVTANAGGEDLVVSGETGFLVPIRNPAAIADRIDWFAANRGALATMRERCRAKAAEYGWPAYAERIVQCLGAPARAAVLGTAGR